MAWNEPGGNNQDPWGGRKNNDGPPDLDEALKKFQDKINTIFGGRGGGGGAGSASGGSAIIGPLIIGLILFLGWFLWKSVYIVDAKEKAVVLQLGVYQTTKGEGFHIIPALINHVEIINTTEIQVYDTGGLMLTEDESIVEMPVTVQYNINDPKAYYLNVREPVSSLKHATDSALRHVVGSSDLDQVLGEGRNKMKVEMRDRLQDYLNNYQTGINIVEVNIRKGQPPEAVKAAFDDVIKAKEDEERFKNEAQAYANAIVPEARGKAQRAIEEATAYRDQVIAKAEGEAERFTQLLTEYTKSPEVTRERLYLDAIESVMANSSKVMVDVEGGNNLLYLPLDKIAGQSAGGLPRTSTETLSPQALREVTNQVVEELRRSQLNSNRRGIR